jgi:hypothetical protein
MTDLAYQFKNAIVPCKQFKTKTKLKPVIKLMKKEIKCYCLFKVFTNCIRPVNYYKVWSYNEIPIVKTSYYYYKSALLIRKQDWTKYKHFVYDYVNKSGMDKEWGFKYRIKLVTVPIFKWLPNGEYEEDIVYFENKPNFVNLGKGHYYIKSNTDVVYHYYKSQRKSWKSSYRSKFHKRQLEYKGWFYDLSDNFDIHKDWETVYNAYLTYLQK